MSTHELTQNQDPITAKIERGALWTRDHWQQVALGASTLFVAGFIAVAMVHNLKRLRERSWEQYAVAQAQYYKGETDKALQSVNQLLSNQRSGPLVSLGTLLKGDVLVKQRKNEDAVLAYQDAEKDAYTADIKALAAFGVAFSLEQSQKWPDSEKAYQQFINDFPEHYLVARAYASMGRIQLVQNHVTDAQASFERIVTLFPTTSWSKDAEALLAQIKSQPSAKPATK